jgi:hypothetical protein
LFGCGYKESNDFKDFNEKFKMFDVEIEWDKVNKVKYWENNKEYRENIDIRIKRFWQKS